MQDVLFLDRLEQADALFKPRRVEVLRLLAEPRTCTEIGRELGDSPQKVYYHVKRLQSAGLVELVDERRVRGIVEGIYRATAQSFWVSPELVGRIGEPRESNEYGIGFLLSLTEELQTDLAGLASQGGPPPPLGIGGEVPLRGDGGAAFVSALQEASQGALDRYSAPGAPPSPPPPACSPRHET